MFSPTLLSAGGASPRHLLLYHKSGDLSMDKLQYLKEKIKPKSRQNQIKMAAFCRQNTPKGGKIMVSWRVVFTRYCNLVRDCISIRAAIRYMETRDKAGDPIPLPLARPYAQAMLGKQEVCRGWFERCLQCISDDRARTYAQLRWGLCNPHVEVCDQMDISDTTARRLCDKISDSEDAMTYPLACLWDALIMPPPGGQAGTEVATA